MIDANVKKIYMLSRAVNISFTSYIVDGANATELQIICLLFISWGAESTEWVTCFVRRGACICLTSLLKQYTHFFRFLSRSLLLFVSCLNFNSSTVHFVLPCMWCVGARKLFPHHTKQTQHTESTAWMCIWMFRPPKRHMNERIAWSSTIEEHKSYGSSNSMRWRRRRRWRRWRQRNRQPPKALPNFRTVRKNNNYHAI